MIFSAFVEIIGFFFLFKFITMVNYTLINFLMQPCILEINPIWSLLYYTVGFNLLKFIQIFCIYVHERDFHVAFVS
jgi:hypothetical protein